MMSASKVEGFGVTPAGALKDTRRVKSRVPVKLPALVPARLRSPRSIGLKLPPPSVVTLNVVPSKVNGPLVGLSEKVLQPVPKQPVVMPAMAKLVIGAADALAGNAPATKTMTENARRYLMGQPLIHGEGYLRWMPDLQ